MKLDMSRSVMWWFNKIYTVSIVGDRLCNYNKMRRSVAESSDLYCNQVVFKVQLAIGAMDWVMGTNTTISFDKCTHREGIAKATNRVQTKQIKPKSLVYSPHLLMMARCLTICTSSYPHASLQQNHSFWQMPQLHQRICLELLASLDDAHK